MTAHHDRGSKIQVHLRPAEPNLDAARDHDDCLVDAEIASWSKRSVDRQPDDSE